MRAVLLDAIEHDTARAQPASVADGLRQLLEDWKEDVEYPVHTQYEECAVAVKRRCFDDLSRILAAPQPPAKESE
jgi:hypothetical protein